MRPVWFATAAAAAWLTAGTDLLAGGFEYEMQGTDTVGRGGANVAHVDDPTALYLNVAGIAKLDGVQLLLDTNITDVDIGVRLHGNQVDSWAVAGEQYPYMYVENHDKPLFGPFIAASFTIPKVKGLAMGLGVFGPAAVGDYTFHRWVTVDTPGGPAQVPGPQRYDLIHERVLFYWPTVALAYRIMPGLVIGAGFQWGVLDLTYSIAGSMARVANPGSYHSDFVAKVHAVDPFVPAGLLGIAWQPLPWLEVGLSLRLSGKVDAKSKSLVVVLSPWEADPLYSDDPTIEWMDDPGFERPSGKIGFMWPTAKLRAGVRFALPKGKAPDPKAPPVPAHMREWFDVELAFFYESSSQVKWMTMKVEGQVPLSREEGQVTVLSPSTGGVFKIARGWEDSWSLRLGGDVNILDGHLSLSWGGFYDKGAAPPAYTRLDFMAFDRLGVSGGIVGRFWKLEVKFSYSHLFYLEREVTNGKITHLQGTGTEGLVTNNGTYEGAIDVFSAGLLAHW